MLKEGQIFKVKCWETEEKGGEPDICLLKVLNKIGSKSFNCTPLNGCPYTKDKYIECGYSPRLGTQEMIPLSNKDYITIFKYLFKIGE